MSSASPTRQELPIVLRALDRLAQEHREETEAQRHERLVALTQVACQEEGLNIPADRVAATVAELLAEDPSPTAMAPMAPPGPQLALSKAAPMTGKVPGDTPKNWRRPTSLVQWVGLLRKHQRWGVRWLRSFSVPSDVHLSLLNLSTLLGLGLAGAAVGHWLGTVLHAGHGVDVLTVLGALGGSLAPLKLSERWLDEYHSIQPATLRPGLAEDVRQCPAAQRYLQACEQSMVPLLEGDLDHLRRQVAQAS